VELWPCQFAFPCSTTAGCATQYVDLHFLRRMQSANQTVVVDLSIGYINDRNRGYERRDANCTVLTARVLRVRSRVCSIGTTACRTTPNRR
jgi:hypothetical protein